MGEKPAGLFEFYCFFEFPVRDGQLGSAINAAAVPRGDDAQKEVALFRCGNAVFESGAIREDRHGALVRHPDFVTELRQECINPVQEFFVTVYCGGDKSGESFVTLVLFLRHGFALLVTLPQGEFKGSLEPHCVYFQQGSSGYFGLALIGALPLAARASPEDYALSQ